MRKILIISVSLVIVVATGLFFVFQKPTLESVSLITKVTEYQRVITAGEELSVTVFSSVEDSFITDHQYVDTAYLKSDEDIIQVDISEIRALGNNQVYNDLVYYAYSFDISFESIQVMNYQMDLEDCILEINYINQKEVALELGNLYLLFQEIQVDSLISIDRMFAVYNQSDYEYISGIYLAIDNFSDLDISITNIYCNNPVLQFDLNETLLVVDEPSYNLGISELLSKPYSSVGVVDNPEVIELDSYTKLLIPMKYLHRLQPIYRFPIMIEYTFNHQSYTHLIDDFIFNSSNIVLEDNYEQLREYIYYY